MLNLLTVNKVLRSIIHYYCLVSRHDLMFSHFVTLTYKQRDNRERFLRQILRTLFSFEITHFIMKRQNFEIFRNGSGQS